MPEALGGNEHGAVRLGCGIPCGEGGFPDLEIAAVHGGLGGQVPYMFSAAEIAFGAKSLIEPVLSDVDAVLTEDFGKFVDGAGGGGCEDGVGKADAGFCISYLFGKFGRESVGIASSYRASGERNYVGINDRVLHINFLLYLPFKFPSVIIVGGAVIPLLIAVDFEMILKFRAGRDGPVELHVEDPVSARRPSASVLFHVIIHRHIMRKDIHADAFVHLDDAYQVVVEILQSGVRAERTGFVFGAYEFEDVCKIPGMLFADAFIHMKYLILSSSFRDRLPSEEL